MEVITGLINSFESYILVMFLTLPRMHAFFMASQLLNSAMIPRIPRNGAIVSLALIATPINMEFASSFEIAGSLGFIAFFAKEYAVGSLFGYLVGWTLWVMQTAGSLIDNQRGAGMTGSFDIIQGEETTPLGNLFSQAFLTYIVVSGSFMYMMSLFYKSYVIWPVSEIIPSFSSAFPAMALALFDYATGLAVVLAGPILAAMFVAEFALAIIGRFAPQIQIFILVMPIKSLVSMVILVFYFFSALGHIDKVVWSQGINFDLLYQLVFSAR